MARRHEAEGNSRVGQPLDEPHEPGNAHRRADGRRPPVRPEFFEGIDHLDLAVDDALEEKRQKNDPVVCRVNDDGSDQRPGLDLRGLKRVVEKIVYKGVSLEAGRPRTQHPTLG